MAIEGGWVWPRRYGVYRMHWIQNGRSLCRNWASDKPVVCDLRPSEYDCKECRRRLDKLVQE